VRRLTLILAAIVLVNVSAFAQESRRSFSVFISDPSFGSSHPGGTSYEGGLGAEFDYAVSRRFSAGVSIGAESHYASSITGDFLVRRVTVRTYPIDAIGRYHFFTRDSRWKPYIGAGLRYVPAPSAQIGVSRYANRLSPEIDAGVVFEVRPSLGIVLDAKELLRNSFSSSNYDPLFKPSIGLRWRF
jgi:outer membrane protein W